MAESAQADGDDGALVLAVQRGDAEAFATLYRRHYPAVRRACERRLFDAHEADEVAQATFVRAFERIDQCAGERRFGRWVHVIARSMCIDSFRAKARVEPREEPLAGGRRDHRPNEPEESLLHLERADQMRQALASLPDRQRRAVIARDWEELRPGEIADRLGLSVSAVDSLLLRARRRLALSYRHLAGERGGGANVSPVRWAAAVVAMAVALGPQAVMTASATAAHTVQDTAERAADGVAGAVASMAMTLGGVPPAAPPGQPPEPPPGATAVVAVRDASTPASRTRDTRWTSAPPRRPEAAPVETAIDQEGASPAPVTPPIAVPGRARDAASPSSTSTSTSTTTTVATPPTTVARVTASADVPTTVEVDLPVVPVPTTVSAPQGPTSDSVKVTVPLPPPVRDITVPTLPLG